jgi:hypothetical protein
MMLALLQEAANSTPPSTPPISYESFLTIVLTALCAILAALAILVGVLAFWGYSGIKDALTKEVRESADKALKEKLKEYPAAAEMVALRTRMEQIEGLRSQITPEPNDLAEASNTVQDEGQGAPSQTLAQDYPPAIGS